MKFPHLPRQPLPGLFLSAIAGIVAAEYWAPVASNMPITLALFLTLAALIVRRKSTAAVLIFTACACFLLHQFAIEDDPGRDLAREFSEKPLVKATGIVVSAPLEKQTSKGDRTAEFQLRLESIEIDNTSMRADAVVFAKWMGDSPAYGDRVSIQGEASNIPPPRNPGQFNYAAYMNRLGIYSEISMLDATSGEVLNSGHGNPVVALALKTRHWVQQKILLDLENSPDIGGLIQGLTLGLKSETPEETRELFQRTGTLHLFVVNGLHIGMFMAIAFLLVRLCGAGRVPAILIVIPLVCFYALLTGSSTGSMRATIMAVILLTGMLVDGRRVMLNNLAAAGLVILACNTKELFMPGCQFSMGVVFTIILLAGPLQRFFSKFGKPDAFLPKSLWSPFQKATQHSKHHISKLLAVSTAASLGSLPFAAGYFNLVTPSSVLANMVVVPMAYLILCTGILSALIGIFSNMHSICLNNIKLLLAHAILWTVHLFAQIPYGHLYVEVPDFKTKPPCEITVLDLGGASAIHLRTAYQDWLIDCGNKVPYETIVLPYLHSRGVNRLDGFILSHGSAKFNGAAISVETDFQPKLSADSLLDDRSPSRREFHQWLKEHGITRTTYQSSDLLEIHATKITILYPPKNSNARLADDKALVLRLDRYGCSVLFVSSSGAVAERWLLDNKRDMLRADILVTNTHDTDTSETPGFIEAVQPGAVIASTEIDGAWARDITARGIKLFRQEQAGGVNISLGMPDGEYVVKAFLGNESFHGTGHYAE